MDENSDQNKQACRDCKYIFYFAFGALLALFIVNYLLGTQVGQESIRNASSTAATSTSASTTQTTLILAGA